MPIKNTRINSSARKIPELFLPPRKIPYLFSDWKNTGIIFATQKNTRFISTAPVQMYRSISVPELSYGLLIYYRRYPIGSQLVPVARGKPDLEIGRFIPIRVVLPDVYNLGNYTVFRRDPDTEPLGNIPLPWVMVYCDVDPEFPSESCGNVDGDFPPSSLTIVLMPAWERRSYHTDYSVAAFCHGRRGEHDGTVGKIDIRLQFDFWFFDLLWRWKCFDYFPAYRGAFVPVEAIVLSRGHEREPAVPLPRDGRQGTAWDSCHIQAPEPRRFCAHAIRWRVGLS